jgi:hypothetical protein
MKFKILFFTLSIIAMIYYIGWVFYISEPKYINNCNKKIEQFDYVSVPYSDYSEEVLNGLVLQLDDNFALVKVKHWSGEYRELNIKDSKYRIVGTGTIYHKVNDYVGFNIMIISQIFIAALLIFLFSSLFPILKDII